MSKKEPKKAKPKNKAEDKKASSTELSEEQLERVAGGASDIFAKIGDIKGESIDDKHTVFTAYTPINPLLKR